MTDRRAVGVLVSGAGTNLKALVRACVAPEFPARVVLVLSNRADTGALAIASDFGIAAQCLPVADFGGNIAVRDLAMRDRLRDAGAELVVCAGYNRILSDEFLNAFPDAILNVHPSLLPAFAGGMDAVEQALAHGVKVTGCTVQLLEPGQTDGGPIVLQAAVPVMPDDDVESLRQRIHEREWQLLPDAVALWCSGRLRREGRVVRVLEAGPVVAGTPPDPRNFVARVALPPAPPPASTPSQAAGAHPSATTGPTAGDA